MTPERKKKIQKVLSKRDAGLALVLENVDDPHNVGAILRSCDAFGVGEVHLLYHGSPTEVRSTTPKMRQLKHSKAAASAAKWLKITKWNSIPKLATYLKKKKFKLAVTHLSNKSVDPASVDLAKNNIAIVIGNERDGVSPELTKKADLNLIIPMVGFVQSFNVSVAAALLLYEAFRQRSRPSSAPAPLKKRLGR